MIFSAQIPTLLIVDGYNMIGAWPHLGQLARQASLELARIKLIEQLSSYIAFRDYRGKVVFDAYNQPAPASQETSATGIEIHYTHYGETADTFIERLCAQLQWQDCRVRVATSDRVQQLVVSGYDAECLSAQQLWQEIKAARQQIRTIKPKRPKSGRGIDRYLDGSTRDRLAHWRLTGNDPAQG
jgi:hypothetical protein